MRLCHSRSFLVLVLGREEKFLAAAAVHGGRPTASFDALRWCNNNSGSWSAPTTMRVNGTAGADLYCSSNSSNSSLMPPITA
jgi:hypothetical protein